MSGLRRDIIRLWGSQYPCNLSTDSLPPQHTLKSPPLQLTLDTVTTKKSKLHFSITEIYFFMNFLLFFQRIRNQHKIPRKPFRQSPKIFIIWLFLGISSWKPETGIVETVCNCLCVIIKLFTLFIVQSNAIVNVNEITVRSSRVVGTSYCQSLSRSNSGFNPNIPSDTG